MAGADNAEARCASAFAALGVPALGDDAVRRLGRADAVVLAKSLEAVAAKAKAGCASAAADDPDEVVELNVGGTVFTTLRATLVAFESSRLEAMLSGRWRVPRDAAGRVFVDRDPALFGRVLAFLRDPAAGVALPAESAAACDELVAEFEWYGLREVALPPLLPGSTVLTRQQGDDAARLLAGLPRHEGRWRLMMRGSQDGFAPSVFHAACDELEESIVAVRTAVGSVVVGYMDAPWGGSVGMNMARSRCALAVLETLRGRAALLLRPQVDPAKACVVCQDPTFGPIFGLFALGGAEGGPLRNDMAVMAGSDSTSVCFGIGCPGSMFERPPGWTDARLLSGSASGCVGLEDVEVWAPALDEPAAADGAARELHGVTTSVVEPRPPRLTREDIKAEAEQMGQLDREAPLHPRQVAASPREYNAMLRLYKSRMSVLRKRYAQEWSARREREQAMLEARQAAWREARAAVKATRVEARAERIATHQRRQKRLRRARTVRQDMSRRRQGLWLLQVDRRQQAWLNALEADSQEWILEHEIDEKITADLFEEGRIPWQYREWFDNLARARAKDEAYARVAASSGAPGAQETEIEISDWEADMVAWESDAVEVGPAKAERDLVEIEDDITPLELAHGMDRKELRRRRAMRLRQYAAKYLLDEESEVLPPDYFSAISQRDAESVGKDVGAPGFFLLPEDIEQLKPPSLKPLLHKDQTVPGAFGEEHAADEAGVSMDPETLREIAKAHARIGWADFPLEDTRVVEADSEDLSDFSTVPSYEEEIVSLVESPRAAIREPRLEQAINPDSDGEIGFESAGSDSEFEAPARGLPVRESVGYAAVDPTTAEARDDLPEHFALNSDAAVHGLLADPSLHHRRMKEQLFGKQKGLNLPVVGTMRSSAHRIHNVRTTNLFMAYRMQTVLSQLQVDKSTMIKAMSVPMRRTTLREILDMAEAAQSGDAAASPPLDADEESAAIARNITESKINLELRPALAGYLDSNFEYRTSEELQEDLLGFTRWNQAAPHMADGELPKEPRSKIKDDDLSDDEPAALESLSRRFHSIPALLRAPPGLMTHRERVDRIMTLMPASVLSEAFQLRMLQLLRENVTSVTLSRQEGETEESPTFHVDGDTARRIREQLAEEFSDAFDRVEADAIQALRVRYSLREHEMLQELGAPVESLLDDANEPVDSDEEYGAAEAKDADVAFAKEAAAGAAEDDATEAAAEAAAAGKEPPAAPAVKELDHFAKELIEKHISSVHRVMVERGVQDGKNYVRDKHRRWTLMQLQGVDALLDRLEEELESPAGQHDLKVDMEPDDAMVTAAAAGHDVPHFLAGSVDIEHMPWELDATLAPDHANELRKRALRETRQAIADRDVLGSEFGVSDVRDDPVFSEAALSEELRYFRPHHLFHDRQGDALETPGTMVPTSELKDRADRVRAASRLARDRAVTSAQLAERPWEAPLVPMRPSPTGRGLEPAPGTPALLVDDGIDLAEDTAIQAAIFANNIPLARRMLEKRRIRLEREAPDVVDRYDVEANFHANMLGMVAQDDLRSSESESDSGKRGSRDSLFSDDDEHDFLFDAEEPDTAAAPFEGAAADFAASDAEADSDGARR